EQVKPTTPTLYNGSFEADVTHLPNDGHNGHAYLNENNVGILSGWQFTNLTNTAMRGGLAWVGGPCQDFLGNQTPPDGRQLAWVQSGSSVDARLYQNVYGFDPTDKNTVYRVSMDLGGRTATDNPRVSLFIGPDQATEDVYINAKEVTKGQFKEYGAVFVPNSDVQTIAIRNLTTTDTSLLVDNVQLKAYNLRNFFSDNYHVKANATGPNIGGPSSNDEPDRFGGLLGALGYTIGVKSNNQIQVGSGDYEGKCKGSLFFATLSASGNDQSQSHASPDYNFANVGAMSAADEGGRMYDISFRVAPQFDEAADSSNWAAVMFGLTESKRTANVNGSDGVGILFRRNGGIQIFDGTNGQTQQNFGAGTYELTDDWADVRVVYFVPDFDGTAPVDVSLYVNDKLISSFQTGKGFLDNFIQFEGYTGNSGYKRSLIDDLVVKSSAELRYDVSRIKDMTRAWSPNGIDKLDVFFTSPRGEETTATHTGALDIGVDTQFDVAEGYTIDQAGATTGSGNINKVGKGTLRLSGNASEYTGAIQINEGSVDLGFNDSVTLTNSISGKGNLINSGKGKTTLTDATYEGSTTVNSGVLSAEILSTDSIVINGGKLEVGFLSAEPPVTINGGQFVIGNTSDTTTLTISNLTLTNGGSISFDMNSFLGDDWDYLETPTANLENGFINLTFNNGDELAWWSNAGEYGYELIDITGWLGGVSNMKVTVDGVESPSWWVDYDNGGIYLMATEVSPTASKYYLANLQSDLDAANWTIDGDAKLGAKLVAGDTLNVTYGKPVILNADGEVEVGDSYNLTLTSVTGSKALNKTGYGTLTLAGANSYTGATTISAGTLALTAENAIASSSSVTNNSAITMGAAQTLNNLTGAGTIDNGGYVLTLNNNAATEFAGVISGAGALVKTGDATLTLSSANTYTGGTTINAGTLKVVATGTLGTGAVTNNSILEFALGEGESMEIGYTIANNDSGKTVKTGAGNLSLTSTSTGNFEIQEGTVTLANSLNNTTKRFGQVTIGPGATLLGASKDSIGHSDEPTMIINVYGTFDSSVSNETFINTQLHMYGGTAKASSGSTFDLYNNTAKVYSHALQGATAENPTNSTISAILLVRNNATIDITTDANSQLSITNVIQSENANGKVVKYGDGTLYLTAVNTFQGGFDIKEGRVISSGPNSSPSNLGTGPIVIEKDAVLECRESNQFGYGANSPNNITIRGTLIPSNYTHIKNVTLESGLIEKEYGYTAGGSGLDFATRTGTITSTGNSTIKSRIHINSGATATFNVKSDTLTVEGVIKSDGGFTKTGAGELKLTAANTYTGATNVSEGTLHLTSTGSLASSGVTVASGATFIDAASEIASAVTLNGGTLTLGDSNSTAEITIGNLTLDGGVINFDFYDSASILNYDYLTTGAATLTSGTINLTFNNDDENAWWNNTQTAGGFVLIDASSMTADLDAVQLTINSAATDNWYLDKTEEYLVLKTQNEPTTDPYYYANTPEAIAETKWTIDGTEKKGVKFVDGDDSTAAYNGGVEMDANGSFQVADGKNLTLTGVLSGEGDITLNKTGDGTLTLSGDNTYSGKTTVSAGTLALTGSAVKANGSIEIADNATLEYNVARNDSKQLTFSDDVTVSGGNVLKTGEGKLKIKADGTQFSSDNFTVSAGELDFKGQYNGDLVVKSGATLSPGNSVGDLTVYGNAIIETGATGLFEFSSYTADKEAQQYDRLFVANDGSFVIDENSIIKLYFEAGDANLWAAEGEEYKLVSDADFDTSVTPTLGNYTGLFDLISKDDGLYLLGLGAGPIPPGPDSGVPEPSTWALLLLGAMGFLYYRKRNK
ncbi:MAG: autotransporter-associated beta strand repeat-containing protein, partial [Thermoguttaceae bacterium]|nr:autotransporter-associated beta strand repeat-containing protein [Thermoguttaceae bacterium]